MALDPNEAPPGCVAVEEPGCWGCEFIHTNCEKLPCVGNLRKDGCDVIFVLKPDKSLIWPYDSEGTPVEVMQ